MKKVHSSNNTASTKPSGRASLKKYSLVGIPALAVTLVLILFFTGILPGKRAPKVLAKDLMKEIKPSQVKSTELNSDFIYPTADFSIELFKQSYNKYENSLVSPTSVFLALGMTANGADGNTLKEFETLLGKNGLTINNLNAYYNSLAKDAVNVKSGKVSLVNSIWYKDDASLKINKDFLKTNADYYNASIYQADFSSARTIKDINNWVKYNTGDLITNIVDKIDENTIMYLINTVYFEDEWKHIYTNSDVHASLFNLGGDKSKSVDFMYSSERYIKDDTAQGFIKPYKNDRYSFVALLPNEGVSLDSYISSLSGKRFVNLLTYGSEGSITVGLPKFKSEYKANMVEPLKKMGLMDCFEPGKANFAKMADNNTNSIFIGDILHKTFIAVDTKGTKAAAATKVEMQTKGQSSAQPLIFNRPFVYAIVDEYTKLPIFIGTMKNP